MQDACVHKCTFSNQFFERNRTHVHICISALFCPRSRMCFVLFLASVRWFSPKICHLVSVSRLVSNVSSDVKSASFFDNAWGGGESGSFFNPQWLSPYGHSAKYSAVVPYYKLVTLWHILANKLVILTPQTNNICRKLRVSAFQQYKGWGVADRVFLSKYALVQKGWGCVFSGFWGDLELRPLFEKYETWSDSYVRSTERKSLPVLKTPRTQQSQLNNGFCQQRWANYCLAVLVQSTYAHTCGTRTVNLANLVFFRGLKCQKFGIWPCP
jgi:hypothetical protein